MRRVRRLALPAAILCATAGTSCTSKADRAARERIFSPEDPPRDVALAREKLDAAAAADDPQLWARLWRMDRREATARVGAHKAASDVAFRWTLGPRAVALDEKHRFETDAAGNFRLALETSEDSGLEFVWAGGRAWARSRYGPFRARRIDRAQQDRWREEATSAPATFFSLCDRRLRTQAPETVDAKGRPALRYVVVAGEPWGPAPATPELPPVAYGLARVAGGPETEADGGQQAARPGTRAADVLRPGPDEDTAQRLRFDSERRLSEASGEILVDRATAVILRASVRGRFVVPAGNPPGPDAFLDLSVSYELTPAAGLSVAPPEDVQESRLAHAVTNPLWFLEGEKAAAEERDEEPEDPSP